MSHNHRHNKTKYIKFNTYKTTQQMTSRTHTIQTPNITTHKYAYNKHTQHMTTHIQNQTHNTIRENPII